MMKPVTAPGLPSSPRIWFDAQQKRARVSLRHPTWQGTEHALQLTEGLIWLGRIGLWCYAWGHFSPHDALGRLIYTFLIVVLAMPAPAMLMRITLPGFFARRLFGARTRLWLTPEAIAIESRLYSRPVIVWRRWDDNEVGMRFIYNVDRTAMRQRSKLGYKRSLPTEHFDHSVMLYVVLTTVSADQAIQSHGHDASMRTIPITEMDSGVANRVTMAYAHALTLTKADPKSKTPQPKTGIDIDTV